MTASRAAPSSSTACPSASTAAASPPPRELALIAEFAAFLTVNGNPPGEPLSATCRSCSSPISWATLPDGKLMPLDAKSVPDGNIAAHRDERGDLQARVLKDGDELVEGERRGVSHFASCPNAAAHRRSR